MWLPGWTLPSTHLKSPPSHPYRPHTIALHGHNNIYGRKAVGARFRSCGRAARRHTWLPNHEPCISVATQALSLAAELQSQTLLMCCADVTSHKFQNLPQKLAEHACSLHLTDLSFR